MKYSMFYKEFKSQLKKQYSSTTSCPMPPVSPFVIEIKQKTLQEIKKTVKTLYKIAHLKNYQKQIQTNQTNFINTHQVNLASLLMAYDFHIDKEGSPKLIEVNTQASGYLVSELVDQIHFSTHLDQTPGETPALLTLKKSFIAEWQSFSKTKGFPNNTLILDHQIAKQKMYVEFLMYKDLLSNQWCWPCQLMEAGNLYFSTEGVLMDKHNKKVDMVYNRLTDFYLESWPVLKKAFLNQVSCISPHPVAYLLLADKARMVEWSNLNFLNKINISEEEKNQIQKTVPKTDYIRSEPVEELWKNRKQFFFKPIRSYGGKAVYKGRSLSRKMFDRIIHAPMLFQTAVPPPVFRDSSGERWKYDIRAYVYQDEVQKLSARVYQGQVTGFQTPLSGFASISC